MWFSLIFAGSVLAIVLIARLLRDWDMSEELDIEPPPGIKPINRTRPGRSETNE